jgi:hypothetical protein
MGAQGISMFYLSGIGLKSGGKTLKITGKTRCACSIYDCLKIKEALKLIRVKNNILILNNAKVINFMSKKRNLYKQVEIPLEWVDRVDRVDRVAIR